MNQSNQGNQKDSNKGTEIKKEGDQPEYKDKLGLDMQDEKNAEAKKEQGAATEPKVEIKPEETVRV